MVRAFCVYAAGGEIIRELTAAWKKHLAGRGYAVRSINSMLASVNSLLDFLRLPGCKVKNIRIQQQTYCAEDKELTKAEAIAALRDTMATMRWEFLERKGLFCRAKLDLKVERKQLFYSVEEYPTIDWEYESSCIYRPHLQVEIIPPGLISKREKEIL